MVMAVMSASAQFRLEAGLTLGAYTKMSSEMSPKAGFYANALYDIKVTESASTAEYIEVGVGFYQNNVDVKSQLYVGSKIGDATTNWLNVPVVSRTSIRAGIGTFDVCLGFYYAYGISGKINADNVSLDVMKEDNGYRIFNSHDFGLVYGLGYTFDFGLGIQVGSQRGIVNIANGDAGLSARSRIWKVGACYFF